MKDLEQRRKWFEQYTKRIEEGVIKPIIEGVSYACPCCGYPTLDERGGFDICSICDWEDDGQDDPRAAEVWGGPNGDYSLAKARENFREYLTMYRPSDQRAFQRSTAPDEMSQKQELMAHFKEMKRQSNV